MVNFEKHGPWTLITGASSGIGETFARQLAPVGMNLFLTARREDRLLKLKEELEEAHHVEVKTFPLDLGDKDAVEKLAKETSEIDIGLVIDNAGFGGMGLFLDQDLELLTNMVNLNCRTTMQVAHIFGNRLLKRGQGGIIITASLASFMATPFMGVYGATKAFDLMLGESIGKELAGTDIDVLCLCPGSTSTEFGSVSGSSSKGPRGMSVEPVVATAIRALGKKRVITTGIMNKLTNFIIRFVPRKTSNTLASASLKKLVPRNKRKTFK